MGSSDTNGTQPNRTPFRIPTVFAPIFTVLLLVAWPLSIPWTYIGEAVQRRQERKFADQMKSAGRLMLWDELKQVAANGSGTVIGEHLSMKGPYRVWWTPENVPEES